jgi:hypothetical protein
MVTGIIFGAAVVVLGPGGILFQGWAERQTWCPDWFKSPKYKSQKGLKL